MNYLRQKDVDNALSKLKGKFFTLTFEKANGETRFMLARFGVNIGQNGKGLKYNPSDRGNMIVYDMLNHGYRTVNRYKIIEIRSQGVKSIRVS